MTDKAEVERIAIVAWLRGQIDAGNRAALQAVTGSRLERDLAAGCVALTRAADAIERGEYLTEPTP